jgi:metal-responsive CopG/Arc/MetJ family transcriptional regulator
MSEPVRIQVLIATDEAERFDSYCRERGFKKSTLIARLVREYLDSEQYWPQKRLFDAQQEGPQ